jgi:hypothetical protein
LKITIISSCTKKKRGKINTPLNLKQLKQIKSGESPVFENELFLQAKEMYTGMQHVQLMDGINLLKKNKDLKINLKIVSAGYGVIDGNLKIYPYDITFSTMKKKELDYISGELNIPEDIEKILKIKDDLKIFLLGKNYLKSCGFDKNIELDSKTVFFGPASCEKLVLKGGIYIGLGNKEGKRFRCNLIGLKGKLCRMFLENILAGKTEFPKEKTEFLNYLENR